MIFSITILGSNSAVPAYNRHPSAQMLHYNGKQFLIDCGEGTQFQMNTYHVKRGNLDHIFISHLHGDHYFGLIGLLNTLRLNGRTKPLYIYAPEKLKEILFSQINFLDRSWSYELHIQSIEQDYQKIYEDEEIEVWTIPMNHKIECAGFLFKEKMGLRKIKPEKINEYAIPYQSIPAIKKGSSYTTPDGTCIPNDELTLPPAPPRSYAYCSDTKYDESILPMISEVNILYHEATFLKEFTDKAEERYHSTAEQAALIAKKSNAKKLIVGHFSARYEDLTPFLTEASSIFPNTALAIEGKTFVIER